MAERTGLEPATSGVTGRRSNQLNYRSNGFREENQTKPVSISPQPENQPDLAAIPLSAGNLPLEPVAGMGLPSGRNPMKIGLWPGSPFPVIVADNRFCRGAVSTYGAHVLSFVPRGGREVLMVSAASEWREGAPIRGGVPVCWPWFGGAGAPAHGTARRQYWNLVAAATEPDGSETVTLELEVAEPHPLRAVFSVRFGAALTMALETANRGPTDFTLSQALHTYLALGDIRQASLVGLENAAYVDTVGGRNALVEGAPGPLVIAAETDRVYQSTAEVVVTDPVIGRAIHVSKRGSDETVVWNPWVDKARRMPDFGDGEYPSMLCVEAANVRGLVVPPAGNHRLEQTVRVDG